MSDAAAPSASAPAPFAAIDPLEQIALKTCKGDVRDWLLDRLKQDHGPLPWHLRGQEEQKRAIEQADAQAADLVRRIWDLAMGQDRPTLVATLKQAKRKGEVIAFEAQIRSSDPLRHAASDCVGSEVLMVLADVDAAMGDRGRPKITKDQPKLFPGDDDEGDGPVFDNTGIGGGR
jgi:hypothetical protein